jgi:RNA polymerase sigma factor (sigma-70 family)
MPAAVDQDPLTDEQCDLVNENLGLAYEIANASKERRLDLDDRRQVAVLGLIRGVQGWSPAKGELSTYATYWIRQAIQRAAAKIRPLVPIDDLEGYEPVDVTEAPGIDPDDAERLRAVVASLPNEARSVVISRFYRGVPSRGRAREYEEAALHLLRKATQGGRAIPASVWWSDPHGQPIRPSKLDADDERAMRTIQLLPRFPVQALSTLSECAHKGPIPRGSRDYCPICDKSGQDGLAIPEKVDPLPLDKPAAPPPKPKKENRRQRRARLHGKAAPARKAG